MLETNYGSEKMIPVVIRLYLSSEKYEITFLKREPSNEVVQVPAGKHVLKKHVWLDLYG